MNTVALMLDSGAFSCWARKQTVSLPEYIEFVGQHADCLDSVVNLDVIPSYPGRPPNEVEVEESAAAGWENLIKMRNAGIEAVPVYHQGERRHWLDRMIDEGFDYIGISPANDRTTQQKEEWLDKVFGHLCGDAGYPEIKTHAFGVTSPRLLDRYPWYSCDSGTWLRAGGYGGILVPKWDRILDDYDYTLFPKVIGMSRSKERGQFGSLGPRKREYVETYLEQEGFELEALKADYLQRQRLCCRFFKNFVARYTRPRFTNRPVTFSRSRSREGADEDRFDPFRIIFIITTAVGHSDILTDEGMKHRLVTYFDFRDGQNRWFDFRNYVQTGRIVRTKKRKVQT